MLLFVPYMTSTAQVCSRSEKYEWSIKSTNRAWFIIYLYLSPPSGLVLYNGQSDTGIGDFLCFGLQDSYPEFRFDVGSGPAIIRGNQSLELNRWHTVKLKRDRKLGRLGTHCCC